MAKRGVKHYCPSEGGYKDKPNNTNSQSGAKSDKNESAKNDKQDSNTQVINPPNSGQKTEIQPTQVIDGPFAGAKDTWSISTASTLTLMARLK